MKLKKIITGILILLVLVFAAVWIFLSGIKNRAVPDYNRDVRINGLTGDVEVFRDSFGIPNVYAENEHDLYLAVGFVMAQDRLWQMDLLRRVTQGRLSEIFGVDMIDADQLLRALRITGKSRRILSKADPAIKEALNAFTDGVNQYIQRTGRKLPPEFAILGYQPEPWLPEQSINLIGYMAWDLSTGWTTEVLLSELKTKLPQELFETLLPNLENQKSWVHPDFKLDRESLVTLNYLKEVTGKIDNLGLDIFRGSNNWAIAGTRSTTGKPLLANDMHLSLMIPGIWYQMHQVIPGKLNVSGVVLPGQPMVVAGHNDKIAWGFTNVMVDDADFYEETINPENPAEYKFNGAWRNLESVEEKIITTKGDTVIRVNSFTHRGPIISKFKNITNHSISMRWLGNEDSNELRTVYLLNRAANWDQFRDALSTFTAVNQNVVYSDIEGNIGLQSATGIPVRKTPGTQVYPGETDEFDWQGLVPFDELPFTFNPPCGYVISANNNTVGPDYPYYISSWFDLPYRKDRIEEMINATGRLSVSDFIKMQGDQKSKLAEKFCPVFVRYLVGTGNFNPVETGALNLLKNWDFQMKKEGAEGDIFDRLYFAVFLNLARDEMGDELVKEFYGDKVLVKNFMENILKQPGSSWCDEIGTIQVKEDFGDIIIRSFKETIAGLSEQLGSDPAAWQWGSQHLFTIKHPMASVKLIDRIFGLSRGPFQVGGSFHTVGPYSYPFTNPAGVDHGASERHIFDLSDLDGSLTVIPTGTSGVPASRHFCDQTGLYVNNQYHTDYLTREKVESTARYRMKLIK